MPGFLDGVKKILRGDEKKNNVVFIVFDREATLVDSIDASLSLADGLLNQPLQLEGERLAVRMGLALENAASVAGMILTTECALVDIKEDAPAMPPMGGGGMPGMM